MFIFLITPAFFNQFNVNSIQPISPGAAALIEINSSKRQAIKKKENINVRVTINGNNSIVRSCAWETD